MSILGTLKMVLLNADEVENDDNTESQIAKIASYNEISDDLKKELTQSLINIDKEQVINLSSNKIRNEIEEDKNKFVKSVKQKSVKEVAEVTEKVKKVQEEKEKE